MYFTSYVSQFFAKNLHKKLCILTQKLKLVTTKQIYLQHIYKSLVIIIKVYCQTKDLGINWKTLKKEKNTSYSVKINVDINIKLIQGTNWINYYN